MRCEAAGTPGFRSPGTQPGTAPTDTYANLTATFKNACKGGDPEQRLSLQALLHTCPGQDPTLQPWEADSVEVAVEPLPANCEPSWGAEPAPLCCDRGAQCPAARAGVLC